MDLEYRVTHLLMPKAREVVVLKVVVLPSQVRWAVIIGSGVVVGVEIQGVLVFVGMIHGMHSLRQVGASLRMAGLQRWPSHSRV